MSSMTPVVLVSLPNLPYLLGTFDTVKFKQWWRSAPFPDELQNIKKGFHIYGRTHLAIAQRTDGLWAVYRSKNYGIDWERAWLAAAGEKIYDIVLITFGWAILNTSKGFYETVNAGKTWTKRSNLPGATATPAFYNIGGGDVLLCTDGHSVWRSTDISRHWTKTCDMDGFFHFDNYDNRKYSGYYTGPSTPAIAGANGRVFVAHGPYLLRSDDGGVLWQEPSYYMYTITAASVQYRVPARAIINDRLWPISQSPKFLVTQINVASVDGPAGDDVVFLFKLDDCVIRSGQSSLLTYVIKTFTLDGYKNNYFEPLFQQFLTPETSSQHLSSYNVAVLGANYNDRLVFSAQTQVVDGVSVPCLKYSTDGGVTWIDIDISKIDIGDPDEGGSYGGSMLDDNFAKLTWVAPACNNQGSYDIVELYRRQCQSYEMDVNIESTPVSWLGHTKSYQADAIVASIQRSKTVSVDAMMSAEKQTPYNLDAFAEGPSTKIYRIDRTCEGTSTIEEAVDAIAEKDQPVIESVDALAQGQPKRYYLVGVFLQSKRSTSYLCDAILVEDGLTETVQKMIAKFPQFMDLFDPGMPYEVYDSRKVTS
jgi:hypothetical protein